MYVFNVSRKGVNSSSSTRWTSHNRKQCILEEFTGKTDEKNKCLDEQTCKCGGYSNARKRIHLRVSSNLPHDIEQSISDKNFYAKMKRGFKRAERTSVRNATRSTMSWTKSFQFGESYCKAYGYYPGFRKIHFWCLKRLASRKREQMKLYQHSHLWVSFLGKSSAL